nr:amidohydrolase family protein [uncultured Desulfobacter sp.]
MIIDAHAHIYPDDVAHKALSTVMKNGNGLVSIHTDGTHSGLVSSMDKANIDYSIVLPVATGIGHGKNILEWIRKMAPLSKRIIFFGSVHPQDPECLETIEEMRNAGIQGIKFHPGYQNFPADSIDALKVYEEILNHDMVLHFHSGFDPSLPQCDYTSVERFSTIVNLFSGSKIVLAHAGGMDEWQKVNDLLGNRGCYFDIAWVLEKMRADDVARELYRQNDDYFLFGTDTPWCDQTDYVQLIQKSDTLTQDQRDKLFFKNILKLIDLP